MIYETINETLRIIFMICFVLALLQGLTNIMLACLFSLIIIYGEEKNGKAK